MSTLDTILAFLQGKEGLTPAQAAGVAGNFQVESGFNTAAYNPKEGAIGLAQWEGGRRQGLQQLARQRGTSETDLDTQLAWLDYELHGPEAPALAAVKASPDAGTAAAVFDQDFERSSGASRGKRIADAQAIAAGSPSSTGSASSGGSGGAGGQSLAASLNTGLLTSWAPAAFTIGLKVLGVGAAAALVIVGAVHTVK